ncbi:MAG: hypothetical protein OEY16_05020 [Alphaproteobacteria bacterium]|nr:hypothetical protein [Alphaproteobacteria bacterium]
MLGRKYAFLATTALVSSLALTGCFGYGDDNNVAAPLEDPDPVLGVFGLEVGVPVNLISATRGDGVSFDKYAVTFNDEEGNSITLTLPDGEEVTFTDADLEYVTDYYGLPRVSMASDDGDQLEFVVGILSGDQVDPDCEDDCVMEDDIPVYAVGRIDEANSWDGFESYGVVGMQTDPMALPRGEIEIVEGEEVGGELIEGHADYDGKFVASLYVDGQIVSDDVKGSAWIDIDFANDLVEFDAKGGYWYAPDHDWYSVNLSGEGGPDDIDFSTSTVYSGDLEGSVEAKLCYHCDSYGYSVEGEFAGAVYGPGGTPGDDPDEVLGDTATAGVFEASSEDNDVMIVGGFGSLEGEYREDSLLDE